MCNKNNHKDNVNKENSLFFSNFINNKNINLAKRLQILFIIVATLTNLGIPRHFASYILPFITLIRGTLKFTVKNIE